LRRCFRAGSGHFRDSRGASKIAHPRVGTDREQLKRPHALASFFFIVYVIR
jgi:hypothetical protein